MHAQGVAVAHQIAEITFTSSGSLDPLHGVVDAAKVAALADDMSVRGWQGPPVVSDGPLSALTGSHRIAAVDGLWNEHGIKVCIPRVDVEDLCEIYGIDWESVLAEYDDHTYWAAAALRDRLPRAVVDYLGFDVDGAL